MYICPFDLNTDFKFKHCLYEDVKLTKNNDPDNYSYSWYDGIGFDPHLLLLIQHSGFGKYFIIFGVGYSS